MDCIKIVQKLITEAAKFESKSRKECQIIIHDNDLINTTNKNSIILATRFCGNKDAIVSLSIENYTTVEFWESGDS